MPTTYAIEVCPRNFSRGLPLLRLIVPLMLNEFYPFLAMRVLARINREHHALHGFMPKIRL